MFRNFSKNMIAQPNLILPWFVNRQLHKRIPGRENASIKKMFESAWSFQSHHQLMSYLSANVVYIDKGGLVVINKPYGLPIKPSPDSPLCLENCLKDLAQVFNEKELKIVKSASRLVLKDAILSIKCQYAAFRILYSYTKRQTSANRTKPGLSFQL